MIKRIFKYLLISAISFIAILLLFYIFFINRPDLAIKSYDQFFLLNSSIEIKSVSSNKNFLNPSFTLEDINIKNQNDTLVALPKITIGINIIKSLVQDHLVLSSLEIDSYEFSTNASEGSFNNVYISGANLNFTSSDIEIKSDFYEILSSDTGLTIVFDNGEMNSFPYDNLNLFIDTSNNKIFYSSEHSIDNEIINNLELFDLSAFAISDINLKLVTKGVFSLDTKNSQRFSKLIFNDTSFTSNTGFKVESINSELYSNIDQSLVGLFSSSLTDQKIIGSLSFTPNQTLSIRTNLLIDMNNILEPNTYINLSGMESFSSLIEIANKKISMTLSSELKRTSISSFIPMLSKPSMTPLKTSIFINDLAEPSYDIRNEIFYANIDKNNFGYFSYGNYFDSEIKNNKHDDGFYVYLSFDKISLDDLGYSSAGTGDSNIKIVKINAKELNILDNKFTNQQLKIDLSKKNINAEITGKDLNGKIDMDPSGFIKIYIEDSRLDLQNFDFNGLQTDYVTSDTINIRFIGKDIRTEDDYFKTIDFYLLSNNTITTIDNINIRSNRFNVSPYKINKKAYISFNRDKDLYKVRGLYEISNGLGILKNISNYDFSFLNTELNVQWNSLSNLINLEGDINFLVKDIYLDRDIPDSTFLKALKVLNLNAVIDAVNDQSSSEKNDVLKINRASGKIVLGESRGFVPGTIVLDTNEASMKWSGDVLKNKEGEMNELRLNLEMRLKISENIPWYAAIIGGIPALAGGIVFENIFEDTLDDVSTINFKVEGTVDDPILVRLD